MGVPKFYRWISERYPKINQVVTDSALLPEFDHLYLDMNGIIHGCTHPSHLDVSDIISERDMMLGIMHYLDRIITQIVKPKVSVYMAIDGVAPRAKLNQQRSRRFRSAKDLAEATKDMDQSDTKKQVFDSNCITPGTEFLKRVSDTIQYFIRKKIKEDPQWRHLTVIFSGHDVPGEGEHKIMQHIREMKSQPHYKPNTRHCMYGQDADLIMLGLVSHEPHFTLLREIIDFSFGGGPNKNALKTVKKFTKESDFQLLHLSILREYLQMEFCPTVEPASSLTSTHLEHTIDDFVFMTFLVGNDFLPHMPSLDIGEGAFDLLFGTYKEQQKGWGEGNYLVEAGEIADAARLEAFIKVIGAAETEVFEKKEEDEAVYVKKRRKWDKRDGKAEGPSDAEIAKAEAEKQGDYLSMIENMMSKHSLEEGTFVDGWTPVAKPGQKDFKGHYYFEKLKMTPIDIKDHLALRKSYIEGLMWCLAYYYKGCISWGWFYPYHYGPMLSDLTNLPQVLSEVNFELGEPLLPFQQLMGCLPPGSAALVPLPYRKLMCEPESPIIKFYPKNFEVDMNGKRNPWEGVNLLPFIDVQLLKSTIATLIPNKLLSPDELERNLFGKVRCYTFDATANETIPSVNKKIGLPDITKCNSSVTVIDVEDRLDITFKPELVPGTQIPYPGFPSLNVLPIDSKELIPIGLNCFGSPSKYPNMVLTLHPMPKLPPAAQIADNIIGKSLYINWPMMHEGRVVAISDATGEIRLVKKKKKVKVFSAVEADRWESESQMMIQQYMTGASYPGSGGVQIGEIQVRLKLVPLQGMRTNPSNGSTKKVFGQEEADVPLQVCLWQAPAPDPRFEEKGPLTIQDRFPENCDVVLTKGKYRGCRGSVVGAADATKVAVKVQVVPPEPPFGLAIARSVQESYISSRDASKLLKMTPDVFGKITGSLFVEPGRYDLGLNLKYGEGLRVLGYARNKPDSPKNGRGGKGKGSTEKTPKAWAAGDSLLVVGSARVGGEENGGKEKYTWEFTPKTVKLVSMYRQKFPQLFTALARYPSERKYDAKQLLGPKGEAMLPEIREWLNNVDSAKLPRAPASTDAMPKEAVAAVERAADVRTAALEKEGAKESLIKVPTSALYKQGSTGATDVVSALDWNDSQAPELGDRIVNICANGIPFGARGTIVSIHEPTSGCVEVVMDQEFIGGSPLQGACSNFRGKLCLWAHLLKISPANSASVVDEMIPQGSGKAAVSKMVSTIEKQEEKTQAPVVMQPERSASVPKRSQQKPMTPNRSRPESSGRAGRQAGWREAKGPDEKGNGFSSMKRRGKSGLAMWKKLVVGGKPGGKQQVDTAQSQPTSTEGLKAILGVTPEAPAMAPPKAAPTVDATAGLKAMLGVQAASQAAAPLPPPVPAPLAAVPPPNPPSAADKLLQMMMSKQQQNGPVMPMSPQPSSFNFSYVEEGKSAPPPPSPSYHSPPPMPMGMPAYHPGMTAPHPGMMMPPQQGFVIPQGGGFAPVPMAMPMHPGVVPVAQPPRNNGAPPVELSSEEFPPLGAEAAPKAEPATPQPAETAPIPPKEKKTPTPMIPSVVVSKAKK